MTDVAFALAGGSSATAAAEVFPVPEALRRRGIALRPQAAEDLEMQLALFTEMRLPELAPLDWPEEAKRGFLAQQFALQQHHYGTYYKGAEFYTVLENGEPIGRLYLDRVAPAEIRLVDIILFERCRGRGLGTAFLETLQALARADGKAVGLHVEAHNPARRLYRRHGFVDVEERPPYIYMTWTPPAASQ